jgi:sulfur-oxidizing protein SoxZ
VPGRELTVTARISIPATAKKGEAIEIRIAIQHPMETGFRFDIEGRAVPKNVINRFVCRFNGSEVFRAEMGSGIAANPFLDFFATAEASGTYEFEWVDDSGVRGTQSARIEVS